MIYNASPKQELEYLKKRQEERVSERAERNTPKPTESKCNHIDMWESLGVSTTQSNGYRGEPIVVTSASIFCRQCGFIKINHRSDVEQSNE